MPRAAVIATALALACSMLLTGAAVPAPDVRVEQQRVSIPGGPELDTTIYLPEALPAPAVLVAHGFGGSKSSVDADARELASRGFVSLAWSARGFGASSGQISLNAPDAEVADARALVDLLAQRPDVVQDAPGDPLVGVTGGSYGGALSLLLAGYDDRVDALAPVITWNDLSQALFPNAATTGRLGFATPARGSFGDDGVFKQGWAGVFFAAGVAPSAAARPPAESQHGGFAATGQQQSHHAADPCGRFTPEVCAAYTEAATTGRISAETAALLGRSSPATVTDRITAPTLLVQGEQDTLFGLDQADANARQIAAAGAPVAVTWYAGGHDGAPPGAEVRERVGEWFDFHLAGRGEDPGTAFAYDVESGVRTGSDTPTGRSVVAPAYPGLAGGAPTAVESLSLEGPPQRALHPAGGSPAAITSLPGAALGSLGTRLAAATAELPGQSARFRTQPVEAPLLVTGAPRADITVARVPGQPAPAEAVLFGKLYEVSPDGLRQLLGGAVAPFRAAVPPDGSPVRVTVTLPAVVAPVEAGNRLAVSVSTTDQGYLGGTEPAVWQIGVAPGGGLSVPTVPGEPVTTNSVPLGAVLGIGGVLAAALLAWGVARWRTRPAPAPDGSALPLEIRDLAKTYRGGFAAVKDVSFDVERGMVLGLLGPNGAGKTTVLRMLMGLIRPTAGGIRAFGRPIAAGAPVLARIGSFVEGPGFLPHLSGADNLRLYWAATGRPTTAAHLEEALEIAGLGASLQRRVGTYSHGMRQRLAIAQAMLGLPEVLVLDEPTNGLDPPQIHAMRDVLRRYAAAGRTVLVSSHLLAEVEQTCSHVVVMHHGSVVARGTVADIIAGGGAASFTVDAPARAAEVLGGLSGVQAVEVEGGQVHAELNGTPRASAVKALVGAGIDVAAAGPRRRLEDAFLALVGEDRTI